MHPNVRRLIDLDANGPAQKSEAWLALRHGMLTASDAATAIGKNKYETAHQLLLRKCGLVPKFQGNEATRHGEKYEDEARVLFEQRYGETVHELGVMQHPVHAFLGGSPDGVTETNCLVEIKCPMMREITHEVPEHYLPQLQLCMEILDLPKAFFIQYKPAEFNWPRPMEFDVVEVERDRGWFEEYFPVMRAFWDKVEYHRANPGELQPPPPPKPRQTRKVKENPIEIVSDSEEEAYLSA